MSPEPVGAVGRPSASRDWRQKNPESDDAFRSAASEIATAPLQSDSTQLSPLAQLVGTLEALKESDPAKYTQVTGQIAENLLAAARIAGSRDDSGAAAELAQLAADFSAASGSGQLHTLLSDLTQAAGAGYAASASGTGGNHSKDTKIRAFLRTNESHTAQNAALDEAAVYVSTVTAVAFDVRTI